MELDDLKNTWKKQSSEKISDAALNALMQRKLNSKISRIVYPEIIGSVICVAAVLFIAFNFSILNTAYLRGVGIVSILLLLTMPALSLTSLRHLQRKTDFSKPYSETLGIFTTQKLRFYKLQRINVTLSYLLLVTVIVLISKFFGGRDITDNRYFWTFAFSFGYIFLMFFAKFTSRFYKKTLRESEELLEELAKFPILANRS